MLGAQALERVLGQNQTWIYRTLEIITDEKVLQKITLRLLQASLPYYAQILHGPLEYGKDIVAVTDEEGRRILRMYQLKCGDITTPIWRNARQELEEMFLVPISDLHLPSSINIDSREAILLCNGHANPYVIPVMEGWFKEQRDRFEREVNFMHIDDLVRMIIKDRLINEFRAVLTELNLEPVI